MVSSVISNWPLYYTCPLNYKGCPLYYLTCKKAYTFYEHQEVIVKQEECVEQEKEVHEYKEESNLVEGLEGGDMGSQKGKKAVEGGQVNSCSDPLAEIKSVWTCRLCGRSARGHLNHTCLYCFSPL